MGTRGECGRFWLTPAQLRAFAATVRLGSVKAAAADLAAQAAELVLSKRAESGGVDPLVERAIPEISKRLQ